jgi:hypothetical protein
MEPIEVTARFSEQGAITPLNFSWNGGRYKVESAGRQWTDEHGQHMLVMVAGAQIYELIFKGVEGRWYIAKTRPERTVI